jgi:hypothetical protein
MGIPPDGTRPHIYINPASLPEHLSKGMGQLRAYSETINSTNPEQREQRSHVIFSKGNTASYKVFSSRNPTVPIEEKQLNEKELQTYLSRATATTQPVRVGLAHPGEGHKASDGSLSTTALNEVCVDGTGNILKPTACDPKPAAPANSWQQLQQKVDTSTGVAAMALATAGLSAIGALAFRRSGRKLPTVTSLTKRTKSTRPTKTPPPRRVTVQRNPLSSSHQASTVVNLATAAGPTAQSTIPLHLPSSGLDDWLSRHLPKLTHKIAPQSSALVVSSSPATVPAPAEQLWTKLKLPDLKTFFKGPATPPKQHPLPTPRGPIGGPDGAIVAAPPGALETKRPQRLRIKRKPLSQQSSPKELRAAAARHALPPWKSKVGLTNAAYRHTVRSVPYAPSNKQELVEHFNALPPSAQSAVMNEVKKTLQAALPTGTLPMPNTALALDTLVPQSHDLLLLLEQHPDVLALVNQLSKTLPPTEAKALMGRVATTLQAGIGMQLSQARHGLGQAISQLPAAKQKLLADVDAHFTALNGGYYSPAILHLTGQLQLALAEGRINGKAVINALQANPNASPKSLLERLLGPLGLPQSYRPNPNSVEALEAAKALPEGRLQTHYLGEIVEPEGIYAPPIKWLPFIEGRLEAVKALQGERRKEFAKQLPQKWLQLPYWLEARALQGEAKNIKQLNNAAVRLGNGALSRLQQARLNMIGPRIQEVEKLVDDKSYPEWVRAFHQRELKLLKGEQAALIKAGGTELPKPQALNPVKPSQQSAAHPPEVTPEVTPQKTANQGHDQPVTGRFATLQQKRLQVVNDRLDTIDQLLNDPKIGAHRRWLLEREQSVRLLEQKALSKDG